MNAILLSVVKRMDRYNFKKYRILLLVMLLIASMGCNRQTGHILEPEKMQEIIVEIHKADAVLGVMRDKYNTKERKLVYESIFKKYGVTKDDFDKTVEWYVQRPEKYEKLYEGVNAKMDSLVADVNDYKFDPQNKPTLSDSLDTIDIWKNLPKTYRYKAKSKNDFHFMLSADSLNLHLDDEILWEFKMRVKTKNLCNCRAVLYINYNDSSRDSIALNVNADSVRYRYTFLKSVKALHPTNISGYFFMSDSAVLTHLDIDSVSMFRIYNKYKNPMHDLDRLHIEDELINDKTLQMRHEKIDNIKRDKLLKQKKNEKNSGK